MTPGRLNRSRALTRVHPGDHPSSAGPGSIIMLSPYPAGPAPWPGSSFAVARYCALLVSHLRAEHPALRITVLADRHRRDKQDTETPEGVTVVRVWAPRRMRSFCALWKELQVHRADDAVFVVHLEMAMFGGAAHSVGFAALLMRLRRAGWRTVLVAHNATTDASAIRGQLNLRRWNLLPYLYVGCLYLWYRALNRLVDECVVLEPAVLRLLRCNGFRGSITVIPHGVERGPTIGPPGEDRRFVSAPTEILVFGFPGWYKGSDLAPRWLSDAAFREGFPHPVRLVIAGSPNPLHTRRPAYRRYLTELERLCDITGTTYIPHVASGDIPALFARTDLVVMPYRVLVGGSAVLSLAIEHRVPFALSGAVQDWLHAPDMAEALRAAGLTPADLVFRNTLELGLLAARMRNRDFRDQVQTMLALLASKRSWAVVARRYHTLLIAASPSPSAPV